MLEAIGSRWWLFLIRGIAAIIFGVLAFGYPGLTLVVLVTVFGIYAIVVGAFAIWTAIAGGMDSRHRWMLALEGLLGIVFGLVVWNYPLMSTVAFVYFFAAWVILTGIAQILFGIEMRDVIKDEWLYILSGVVSIVFGILVLRNPGAGALAAAWIIGFYAVLAGVLQIGLSLRLRGMHQKLASPA